MKEKYSQLRAMLAITKASLKATFRSPSAVVFSIGFPLIFILVFGFIGEGSGFSLDVALDKSSDTSSQVYTILKQIQGIHFVNKPYSLLKENLEKGNITAIINIKKNQSENTANIIQLKSSQAVKPQDLQLLQSILNSVISNINRSTYPPAPTIPQIDAKLPKI